MLAADSMNRRQIFLIPVAFIVTRTDTQDLSIFFPAICFIDKPCISSLLQKNAVSLQLKMNSGTFPSRRPQMHSCSSWALSGDSEPASPCCWWSESMCCSLNELSQPAEWHAVFTDVQVCNSSLPLLNDQQACHNVPKGLMNLHPQTETHFKLRESHCSDPAGSSINIPIPNMHPPISFPALSNVKYCTESPSLCSPWTCWNAWLFQAESICSFHDIENVQFLCQCECIFLWHRFWMVLSWHCPYFPVGGAVSVLRLVFGPGLVCWLPFLLTAMGGMWTRDCTSIS